MSYQNTLSDPLPQRNLLSFDFLCVCVCVCVFFVVVVVVVVRVCVLLFLSASTCLWFKKNYLVTWAATRRLRGLNSYSGGWMLLCKDFIRADDSPYVTMQRTTTL